MKHETRWLKPLLGHNLGLTVPSGEGLHAVTSARELFSHLRTVPEYSDFDDLTLACLAGDIDKVRELLAHGADPNGPSDRDTTPLLEALAHSHPDIGQLLLANGAGAVGRNSAGWTALHLAASNGWSEITRQILLQDVDVNSQTSNGWTPLILAAMRKRVDVLGILLDSKADTEVRDDGGATAILYATIGGEDESGGDFSCLNALLASAARVNIQDDRGWTPLMGAAFYGQADSVRLLIDHGAEINLRTKDGRTALALAEINQQAQVVARLKIAGGGTY